MALGLFALAVTLTMLSGILLLVVGATCDREGPRSFELPTFGNIMLAFAMLIAQAICWVTWAGVPAGGA